MRGFRGGQSVRTPPHLKNHKIYRVLSNTDPDPIINHKATKPAFNAGPSSAFRWRAVDGPLSVAF